MSEAGFASAQQGRTYTARIREADVRDAFGRVDLPDVEAPAQVGASAGPCGFVDALEVRHG